MALNFEWDTDIHGQKTLIAYKTRGKISITELKEAMNENYRYNGTWAVIFRASDELGCSGWNGGGKAAKGDVVELHQIGDGEDCPVCTAVSLPEECPHCGESLQEEL